jgi:succinate dehydrogenase/fumarate reductase flavoprotein subunit
MSTKKKLSRREFFKDAAIGAAAVTGVGVLFAKPTQAKTAGSLPGVPAKWDYQTDVIVVGYGGAGAFAAIAAAEAGAKVIILEKAPEGGGSTRMSGGNFTVTNDPADAAKYLFAASGLVTPMEQCQAWAQEIAKTTAWFDKYQIKYTTRPQEMFGADFKNFPGANAIRSIVITGLGPALYSQTDAIIKANKNIKLMLKTSSAALVQNPVTREVLGVIAESGGKSIAVKAKRGVVLSAGGFEYNETMVNNYLRPVPLKPVGWKYNTGDAILMAQAIGADLWHMNMIASCGLATVTPGTDIGWKRPNAKSGNNVIVDRFGSRFICENPELNAHRTWMYFDIWDWSQTQKDSGYRVIPSYIVFDETARMAGPVCDLATGPSTGNIKLPKELGGAPDGWSKDNSGEIAKGWIIKGNTIEELAKAIGEDMDAAVLKATIEKYNGYVKAGKDPDFNRNPKSLAPVEKPPFYALKIWPGIFNTCGGPRKNEKAQVLDTKQKVIRRLYAAGSVSHSAAHLYSTFGQNLAENFAFGNVAGRNVASEKPWDV